MTSIERTAAPADTLAPASAIRPITKRTYANPVPYVDGKFRTAPDPFVLRYRDLYYCYATDEHGVLASSSPDLVHWASHGYVVTEEGRKNFWAPSVILINGVFHMYYSNMPEEETDTHAEVMRVATSPDPLGPFERQTELFGTFAIDSQVVYGDDGRLYLLYADNQAAGLSDYRPGTSVMVDRLVAPTLRENRPRPLIVPTMDEEIFARNRFGDGRDWHTVEGATYFTHRNRAYITYSANAYEHEDYFVGYSTADLPADPTAVHVDRLDWTKQLNAGHFDPLLIRSPQVEGTGHNSIVKAPNGVDDWIVYHGRNASDELYVGTEQRVMRIDPLYYAENGLDTPGPTAEERDAPYAATSAAGFADGIPAGWTVIEGGASVETDACGAALVAAESGAFLAVDGTMTPSATVVASVWARAPHTPLGERFGLVVRYVDAANLTMLEVDTGGGMIRLIDVTNGIAEECASVALADMDIDPSCWHEYRVEKAYSDCTVRVDGRFATHAAVEDGAGTTGLFAVGTAACFAGFLATDHVDLWGASLVAMGREADPEGRFVADAAGLHPLAVRPETMTMHRPLDDGRLVLDFALGSDRSRALAAVNGYRLSVGAEGVNLLHDGKVLPPAIQPERLRVIDDSPRRDRHGRVLRTVRLTASSGLLTVHTRGRTWQVPVEGEVGVAVTLDDTSLVGYTRTTLTSGIGPREGV